MTMRFGKVRFRIGKGLNNWLGMVEGSEDKPPFYPLPPLRRPQSLRGGVAITGGKAARLLTSP
jgi:hypothetical protein